MNEHQGNLNTLWTLVHNNVSKLVRQLGQMYHINVHNRRKLDAEYMEFSAQLLLYGKYKNILILKVY